MSETKNIMEEKEADSMEYTKESLIKDLEHKAKETQELLDGINWIIEHYKEGTLPE